MTEDHEQYLLRVFGIRLTGGRVQSVLRNDIQTQAVVVTIQGQTPIVIFADGSTVMEYLEFQPDTIIRRFRLLACKEIRKDLNQADVYEAILQGIDVARMLRCFEYMDSVPISPEIGAYLAFHPTKGRFYVAKRDVSEHYPALEG